MCTVGTKGLNGDLDYKKDGEGTVTETHILNNLLYLKNYRMLLP